MSVGYSHACALKTDGTVTCWGAALLQLCSTGGCVGCCMLKPQTVRLTSICILCAGLNEAGQTTVPSGLSNVTQIAAGDYHTCALKRNGAIVCWGTPLYYSSRMPPCYTHAKLPCRRWFPMPTGIMLCRVSPQYHPQ